MPWTYAIDKERDVLLITAAGILTAQELQFGVATATSDVSFHPDIRIFIDYRAVTNFGFSLDTVEAMASNQVYSPKSRRAFLVASGVAAGIFQMYRTMVQAGIVRVFNDRNAALAWLNEGVPPEKILT